MTDLTDQELDEAIEEASVELEALNAQRNKADQRLNELRRQRNNRKLRAARDRIAAGDFSLWIRRNGKVVAIAKMDQNHLTNTIRMLERGRRRHQDPEDSSLAEETTVAQRQGWLGAMKAEVERRKAEGLWKFEGLEPLRRAFVEEDFSS